MPTKIADLAKELNLKTPQLKDKITEFGFELAKGARNIEDDMAELIRMELTEQAEEDIIEEPQGAADLYEGIIDRQLDREIIKKQRKSMAGKEKSKQTKKEEQVEEEDTKGKAVKIDELITVKELGEKTGVSAAKLIGELMKNGILANINQQIDFETAQIIVGDLGVKLKRNQSSANVSDVLSGDLSALLKEDEDAKLEERAPIVCVMGHVDHGKTKLLDSIRETDVVAGEHGGITQHVAAYQVTKNKRKITFLDTPGHEAFSAMRARGARVTDIAILVVAADEGVKPQTIEALNHAKEAGVPIIVAINKMDKENANPDKVKGELAEHGLQAEDWGGKTIMVPISALTKDGIPNLLDMVLLVADLEELKANSNRPAVGTVIEAHLDKNLGPVATVLVNTGTLKLMDNVFVGSKYGRIKVLRDHHGKNIKKAGPATPVFIAGLNETPQSGNILSVAKNEKESREKALAVSTMRDAEAKKASMAELAAQVSAGDLKTIKLVLKADVKGSLEALKEKIAEIRNDDVGVKIIHAGVGHVSNSDVSMAAASGGIVFAFNVKVLPQVDKVADRLGIEIVEYNIIYKLLEDLKSIVSGLLEPEIIEVDLGKLEVKQIFLTKKKDQILGGKVLSGKLQKDAKLRVMRKNAEGEMEQVGEGRILSLKKVDKDVKEIGEGNECGMKYKGDVLAEEGDEFHAYKIEERERSLE